MANVGGVKNVIGLLVNTNMAVDTKLTKNTIRKKSIQSTQNDGTCHVCMKDPNKFNELLLYPQSAG